MSIYYQNDTYRADAISSEPSDRYRDSATEYDVANGMNDIGTRDNVDLSDDMSNDVQETTCSWQYISDEVW